MELTAAGARQPAGALLNAADSVESALSPGRPVVTPLLRRLV